MNYQTLRADFEYLESLAELPDWMGAEEEFVFFLRDPSKKKAADIYDGLIRAWFRQNCFTNYPESLKIAEKYNIRCSTL